MTLDLDFAQVVAQAERDQKDRTAKAVAGLKAIYAWMEGAGMKGDIGIHYEGSGDSGQIEDISYHCNSDTSTPPEELKAALAEAGYQAGPAGVIIDDALDCLGWDVAYGTNPGFEINDGGCGTITITRAEDGEIKVIVEHQYMQYVDDVPVTF